MNVNRKDLEIFMGQYEASLDKIPLLLLNADLAFSDLTKKSILAECLVCVWKQTGYFEISMASSIELDEYILKEAKDVAIRAVFNKNHEAFKEIGKMVAVFLHTIGSSVGHVVNELVETHKIQHKSMYEDKVSIQDILNRNAQGGTKKWEKQGST